MSASLSEIIYLSRERKLNTEHCDNEIAKLIAIFRQNNERNGITGALLFNNGCFAQLMEGPTTAVNQLFEKIRMDPRHHDVVLLSRGVLTTRTFPDWAMSFVATEDDDDLAATLAHTLTNPDEAAPAIIRTILQQSIAKIQVWGTLNPNG
jgi:hypothetical protein